jgi:hypothetical protein
MKGMTCPGSDRRRRPVWIGGRRAPTVSERRPTRVRQGDGVLGAPHAGGHAPPLVLGGFSHF